MNDRQREVHAAMAAINKAWREGEPLAMAGMLHAGIVMVMPGFSGTVTGRQALLDGFVEFCSNARVVEYEESDEQIQVIDDLAVLTFRFAMVYERPGYRARSKGRDMWVFRSIGGKWLALWRTMMELEETRETPP
jgi:hypothetical protein